MNSYINNQLYVQVIVINKTKQVPNPLTHKNNGFGKVPIIQPDIITVLLLLNLS